MKNQFKQNMGVLDRVLRLIAGTIFIVLATSVVTGAAAVVLAVLSIPLVIPSITGFCPAYVLFGISTKREAAVDTN